MINSTVPGILIFSGGGDFTDPWHPFAATSARIAEILEERGRDVVVVDRIDDAVEALGSGDIELLIVNAGHAEQSHPRESELMTAIERHLANGHPLLALHVSSTLFADIDAWERLLGGRWVRDVTMHPEYGRDPIMVATDEHEVVAGVQSFEVEDERYAYMRVSSDVIPLAEHEHDGIRHPLLWAREIAGARIVVDLLGHDLASYDSPERRSILGQSVDWLLAP